jgi:hypothetical protein
MEGLPLTCFSKANGLVPLYESDTASAPFSLAKVFQLI